MERKSHLLSLALLLLALSELSLCTGDQPTSQKSKISMEVLQNESRGCNEHILKGKSSCISKPNCCYYESYIDEYEEHNNFCVGLNNFIQLHAKNVPEYLKSINEQGF